MAKKKQKLESAEREPLSASETKEAAFNARIIELATALGDGPVCTLRLRAQYIKLTGKECHPAEVYRALAFCSHFVYDYSDNKFRHRGAVV